MDFLFKKQVGARKAAKKVTSSSSNPGLFTASNLLFLYSRPGLCPLLLQRIAGHIAENNLLKALIRLLLLPVIAAAYLFLHPWLMLTVLPPLFVLFYYRRKVLCR
jgi:hypothetical protein